MKATIRMLAACTLLAAGAAGAQSAGSFIDASNRSIDRKAGGMAIGGHDEQVLAQTMTVQAGGIIDGVYLPVACTSGDLRLEIRDVQGGEPGNLVLDEIDVPAAALPAIGPRFQFIALPGGVKVQPGEEIAVVMSSKGDCGIFRSTLAPGYAGGRAFFDSRPNAAGVWLANGDFPGEPDDLPFALMLY
jgi:hypothetical protein